MKNSVLIYNINVVDSEINIKNGAILVENGKISGFPSKEAVQKILSDDFIEKIDGQGKTLMPGFIDTHAHFRDPGLTYKEDIESGCAAAAKGGYTTVVLMPNTKPVVSSLEMARINNKKAAELGLCNVIQTVSITKDFGGIDISHLDELNQKEIPVITEDGKEVRDSFVMFNAMKKAAAKKIIVSCHCEDPFLADAARPIRKEVLALIADGKKAEAKKLLKNADEILELAEDSATLRNIRLAKNSGCHIHLCHVSTKVCVEAAKAAKKQGQQITFEITPHHIYFASDVGNNLFNIVNPPLRNQENRKALIDSILDGSCDCIGTDHAPHSSQDKLDGAPGFSGIETAFGVCSTVLVHENKMKPKDLSRVMSSRPAEILGLKNKGLIAEGMDADLVLVDFEKEWKVETKDFLSKGKFSPLEGKKLTGKVMMTICGGKVSYNGF